MDIIGFLSGLLENKNIVFAVVGLIVVLVLLSAFPQHQSSPPEEKKECDVCSDKEFTLKTTTETYGKKRIFVRNADGSYIKSKQAGNKLSAYFFTPHNNRRHCYRFHSFRRNLHPSYPHHRNPHYCRYPRRSHCRSCRPRRNFLHLP